MKKFLALLLALSMALALVACGGNSGNSGNSGNAGDSSTSDNGGAANDGAATNNSGSADNGASTDNGGDATATAGGTFKLGGIGPMTGGAAQYGMAAMTGAQIAVDEINALGGDIQFEFQPEDDQAVADNAVNAYNTLKDNGMQILVGAVTTGSCIAVASEANTDRIFALTPSASSTDVTAGKDNMFQMCFTDPNQGVAGAQYISENFAGKSVAVIYRNDDAYSTGIYEAFKAEMGDAIVYEGTFTGDTQADFSVQVTAAKDAGAEVVYLPMYYQPATVILTYAKSIGYAPAFIGVDGMDGILDQENFDASLAEGVLVMSPFSASATDDLTVSFVTEYEDRLGQLPNQFAADGYDCVYAIYNAIQEAGITSDMSNEEICDALIGVFTSDSFSYTGLTGSGMTWGTNGEVTKLPMAFIIQDGIYVKP